MIYVIDRTRNSVIDRVASESQLFVFLVESIHILKQVFLLLVTKISFPCCKNVICCIDLSVLFLLTSFTVGWPVSEARLKFNPEVHLLSRNALRSQGNTGRPSSDVTGFKIMRIDAVASSSCSTILEKLNGTLRPPLPPKSVMGKWRVLAFTHLHP